MNVISLLLFRHSHDCERSRIWLNDRGDGCWLGIQEPFSFLVLAYNLDLDYIPYLLIVQDINLVGYILEAADDGFEVVVHKTSLNKPVNL